MRKILAITNQKGGVGKTTTTINLAASLAAAKQRVLLVDLDPQGNATMGSGIEKRDLPATVYHVLLGSNSIQEVRRRSEVGKYDVLPANRELAGAEIELVDLPQRETRLKDALQTVTGEYDYVLIDCPPALNLLTLNGLCAARSVMIPMQCEYYALEGLSDLGQHDTKSAGQSQSRFSKSRVCCAPCLTREILWRNRSRINCSSTLATRFTARLFRAMCGWRRHPATACQCSITTRFPRGRKLTLLWRASCSITRQSPQPSKSKVMTW